MALEAPLGMVAGGGGSGGSGPGGGAACLGRWHAVGLVDVQSRLMMVTLAGDVAAAPSDVLVLGLALSLVDNVVPLQVVPSPSLIITADPMIHSTYRQRSTSAAELLRPGAAP